jgi:hypothetical protein
MSIQRNIRRGIVTHKLHAFALNGSTRDECDEIWSFCYAKDKNVKTAKAAPDGAGDVWTWTAIDADSKMILSYEVGDRSALQHMSFCLICGRVLAIAFN